MIRELIEQIAQGIEVLSVLIIVGGIVYSIGRYLFHRTQQVGNEYKRFKHGIGKSLLLGLEFLVAADIIRTVALSPTMHNIAVLGVLVIIRTFLSWSLVVEMEGRWPWQKREEAVPGTRGGKSTMLPQGATGLAAESKTERRE